MNNDDKDFGHFLIVPGDERRMKFIGPFQKAKAGFVSVLLISIITLVKAGFVKKHKTEYITGY